MNFFKTYKEVLQNLDLSIKKCKGNSEKLDEFINKIKKKLIPESKKLIKNCGVPSECSWADKFMMNIIHIRTTEILLDTIGIEDLNKCEDKYMKKYTWVLNRSRNILKKFLG